MVACPPESNWFDNAGSSGSTDDRISSTHSVVFDEKKLITPIQEILENAKNPSGVQGFDMYETPNGCLVGHLRNSLDFVSPIDPLIPESYVYKRDIHPIVNKQKVYGAKLKTYPSGPDDWFEATTGWTLNKGALDTDASAKVGSYSLKITTSELDGGIYTGRITRTFSSIYCEPRLRRSYKKYRIYAKKGQSAGLLKVKILAPDTSNYFYEYYNMATEAWQDKPFEITLDLGEIDTGKMFASGSPDLKNVQGIEIQFQAGTATDYILIDCGYFAEAPYIGEAEDGTSQDIYGVKCGEPIIDEALMSDVECLARAQSIVKQLKDPVKSLENVITDGNEGLWPGQRQHIHGSNDGIDETFRIIEVEDRVQGCQWDAILTLDNEPPLIDLAFLLIEARMKRLEHKP